MLERETLTPCDVTVVGGGISGMVAALRAAQGGKRANVLEKSVEDRYLCNSRITAGIWHCCQMDLRRDPSELEAAIHSVTGGNARPDLALAVAIDGIRAVRWLQSVGIRFIKGPQDYQSFMLSPPTITPQGRQWEGRGGDVMLRTLEAELTKLGGRVLRGHKVTNLEMIDGRVSGVVGEQVSGGGFKLSSTVTVIADGGFQANPELTRGAISPVPEKLFQRNARTGVGDGLRMSWAVGADVADLRGFYGHVLSRDAFSNEKLWPYPWLDFVLAAGIVVDRSGRRIDDEGLGGVHMANAIAVQRDPLGTVVIADRTVWEERGRYNIMPPNPRLPESGGTLFTAGSLAELAGQAGLDRDGFLEQIEIYNNAVKMGQTLGLAPPRSTHKFAPYVIETPPFHAIPACAGITYTMGGISIDAAARVLTPAGAVIPGLYAVGCATGGLEGGERKGYVGGLVKSSVTALRAAEHLLGQP